MSPRFVSLFLILAAWGTVAFPATAVARGLAHVAPAAAFAAGSAGLIYVSDQHQNAVLIFDQAGHHQGPIGKITTGIDEPDGLAVAADGTLFVANIRSRTVTAYPKGQTVPSASFAVGPDRPVDVAVGNDGTLYVADFAVSPRAGVVLEFAPGSRVPTRRIHDFDQTSPIGLTLDANNDLFASYGVPFNGGIGAINEYSPGATTGQTLPITLSFAPGMTFDRRGNLIATDEDEPAVDVFPPGRRRPSQTIRAGLNRPFAVAFNAAGSELYVVDIGSRSVVAYDYPSAVEVNVIHFPFFDPLGIALSPALPH